MDSSDQEGEETQHNQEELEESKRFKIPEKLREALAEASRDWQDAQALTQAMTNRDKQLLKDTTEQMEKQSEEKKDYIPQRRANEIVVKKFQDRDTWTQHMLEELRESPSGKVKKAPYGGPQQTYCEQNGLLYHVGRRNRKTLHVPKPLRQHLMNAFHRSKVMLHPGQKAMEKQLKQDYHWIGMQASIRAYIEGTGNSIVCRSTYFDVDLHIWRKFLHICATKTLCRSTYSNM